MSHDPLFIHSAPRIVVRLHTESCLLIFNHAGLSDSHGIKIGVVSVRGLIPGCREDGVNISTPGKLQETEGAGIHDGSSHPGSCLWGWESRQSTPK